MSNFILLVSCVYILMALLGMIEFHLWSQVEYIYNLHATIFDIWEDKGFEDAEWKNTGNAHFLRFHFLRYLLVYPVYWLADTFLLEHDYVFSIVCSLLILGTALVLTKVYETLSKKTSNAVRLILLVFFIGLSLFMNGRIIFAHFAMSLVLLLYVYWVENIEVSTIKLSIIIVSALWFSSVSSGTFMVIFVMFLFILLDILITILRRNDNKNLLPKMAGVLAFFLFLFFPWCVIFIDKNLSYFGGFLPMLRHGMGSILLILPYEVLFLLLFLLGVLFLILYQKINRNRPFFVGIVIACGGGMFGYSTLTMLFPPLVLFLLFFFKEYEFFSKNAQDC